MSRFDNRTVDIGNINPNSFTHNPHKFVEACKPCCQAFHFNFFGASCVLSIVAEPEGIGVVLEVTT